MRVVVVAACFGAVGLAGCGGGPDFEGEFFKISLDNDLGDRATIRYCKDSSCHAYGASVSIAAGRSAPVNVSDKKLRTTWRVFEDGRSMGCITRTFSRKLKGIHIGLSTSQPC